MTVTSLLELTLRPDAVDGSAAVLHETLTATRGFAGCLGVDVLRDVEDPARVVVLERWESLEADDAYRAFRLTPDGASALGTILAEPPKLTRTTTDPDA